ncbi:MAG: efflux RND transporter periplasmic adaptor subunit [Nevskiaceae bacterium]
MKKIIAAIIAVALSIAGGVWVASNWADWTNPAEGEPGHKHQLAKKTDAEGKTYYTCSMHPQVKLDEPGNCPICGMKLIKKTENSSAAALMSGGDRDAGVVTIDPRVLQNLGIRTAAVERGTIAQELRVAGSVMANENRIEVVQTRTAGWVERLHVRAVNDPVRRGQLLAEIYSPELFAAQQEFLLALRAKDEALVQASRQRLSLLGLSEGQIERLEQAGEAQRRVAYFAPIDGIVSELGVREGAQLSPGMSLYTLADLSRVWVIAEVPEAQAANLARGSKVEAAVAALRGRRFMGRVDYVYPEVKPETRTVQVRTVFDNANLALKPGMFADVLLSKGESRSVLLVPSESVIRTGTRITVIVAEGGGRFRPVIVTTGGERGGQTEVLSGLEDGQQVVASGQFLIDSEANLRGVLTRLAPPDRESTEMETEKTP